MNNRDDDLPEYAVLQEIDMYGLIKVVEFQQSGIIAVLINGKLVTNDDFHSMGQVSAKNDVYSNVINPSNGRNQL